MLPYTQRTVTERRGGRGGRNDRGDRRPRNDENAEEATLADVIVDDFPTTGEITEAEEAQ